MRLRRVACVLGVLALLAAALVGAAPAVAGGGYRPPVEAPVIDGFRPPARDYGAGNRGLQYGTAPGTDVHAAADGEVVFAGQVGGALHVVVLHPDGLRTTYAYLSTIRVHRGDRVGQGQVLGTTGPEPFHFGVRAGDVYLDPATLFTGGPPDVHLVPERERRPAPETEERGGLLGFLGALPGRASDAVGGVVHGGAGVGADAIGWVAGRAGEVVSAAADAAPDLALAALRRQTIGSLEALRDLAIRCAQLSPPMRAFALGQAIGDVLFPGACTPGHVPPRPLPTRHIVVLVGGLGSSGGATGGGAAIFGVDTSALGYAPGDVLRYSYRGGTAAQNPYSKQDTEVDIRESGARLRDLLEKIRYDNPGVPVDILAHSQGGLVTRAALVGYDRTDPRLPELGAVVTLGSPHRGTDPATTLAAIRRSPVADPLLAGVHAAVPGVDDPRAVSIAQMAEGSEFIRNLNDTPIPDGVYFTSIGAREDWLVPSPNTQLAGAHNTVVHVGGATAHDSLPSSMVGEREIALALSHMPPTCRRIGTRIGDAVAGAAIKQWHSGLRSQLPTFPEVAP